MSVERLLVMRGAGALWGVSHAAVRTVTRLRRGYRVHVGKRALAAETVLGVFEAVEVYPAGAVMARYWSQPTGGLAVHGDEPLVVIDPDRPPPMLDADPAEPGERTETADANDRQPSE